MIDLELPVIVTVNDPEEAEGLTFSQLDLDVHMFRFLNIDVVGSVEEGGIVYPLVYSGGYGYMISMTLEDCNKKITKALNEK